MLDTARKLLADREARYPAFVTAGRLTPEDAARGLELARVLVAQWHWVVRGQGDAPWDEERDVYGFGAHERDLEADLTGAASRAPALAQREGTPAAARYADALAALAWWQQRPHGCARIVLHVEVMRAAAAAAQLPEQRKEAA